MKLSQIVNLNSDRAVNAVLSRIATSECSKAWGQFKKLTRAQPYAQANNAAFTAVNEADKALAVHGRNFFQLVATLDAKNFVLDVANVLEYVCSSAKPKTNEQITELAKVSGLSEATLRKASDEQRLKQIEQGLKLKASFASRFGEYEFDTDENGADIEVPAENVLKAIESLRLRIATWDKPDMAELMMLKNDSDIVETIVVREMEYNERAGEASREQDDKAASAEDMAAGQASST